MTSVTLSENKASQDSVCRHESTYCPRRSLFSKIHFLAVLFLIFMGALVKSNEAGLAVPDWPTTFGHNMFLYPPSQWTGGIFYEHSHRLVASVVGILTVIMTFWIARAESRQWVRFVSYAMLFVVILQGALGGITVLFKLPPLISIFHGVLAQIFLILSMTVAYSQSRELCNSTVAWADARLWRSSAVMVALILLQLILGAVMRHSGSGLAIPDFPTMGGQIWPNFDGATMTYINDHRFSVGLRPISPNQAIIHLFHRIGAVLLTVGLITFCLNLRKSTTSSLLKDSSRRLLIILLLQWTLGMYTIWTVRDPIVASLHVLVGALLLSFTVLTTLRLKFLATNR